MKNYLIEETATSWNEFLRIVNGNKYSNWAFRGQENADWQLVPSIVRELKNRKIKHEYWDHQEHRNIWVFQRKAALFLDKIPAVHDIFEWLAILQHYGAPTRLLDFTWSPYVAAFFALESSVADAAVWMINAPAIKSQCFRSDTWKDEWVVSPKEALERFSINENNLVGIGEPFLKNQRQIAQSGTFVIPYQLNKTIDELLSTEENRIAKITLKGFKIRREAKKNLYAMNITQATLFPGLDGLARSLKNELEFHYEFDPVDENL